MKVPRCPKCKSLPSLYSEIVVVSLDYDVDEDGFPDDSPGSGSSSNPEPQKATATCSECGYVWTLRGVASLSYLKKENRT